MHPHPNILKTSILALTSAVVLTAILALEPQAGSKGLHMPYAEAGLSERQAAEHLLSRFTYGATPEDIDRIVRTGLEKWFLEQLDGRIPDPQLEARLSGYDALNKSNAEVLAEFPRPARLYQEALQAGYIKAGTDPNDKKSPEVRQGIKDYMAAKGYRPQQELFHQFFTQKILRATYAKNQLHEVLTDFWFNHFNVSLTKNECAPYIPAYERDVIRPHVAGKFRDLLLATAKSPAMLFYLDNFSSTGDNDQMQVQRARVERRIEQKMEEEKGTDAQAQLEKRKARLQSQGLNENYAREIMELHTLGVDGGYTQQDVTEAARVLTGWTIFPANEEGPGKFIRKMIDQVGEDRMTSVGFVHEGDFLFAMSRHDTKEKSVLGHRFPAGHGYDEGVELIDMLSRHPSTARFICRKIAVRFVNDAPPASLIERMSKVYEQKDGDIAELLKTLVSSPEFWSKEARTEKTRSPFELAMAAIRTLHAEVKEIYPLNNYITRMGQKLYYYQAPTGFPDKGSFWINAGSLLNRMNFGMDLATHRIPGVRFDLAVLDEGHEPESASAALATFAPMLLPQRDIAPTLKRLDALVNDPSIGEKIGTAASHITPSDEPDDEMMDENVGTKAKIKPGGKKSTAILLQPGKNDALSQVVGIIIGSPEFQRR